MNSIVLVLCLVIAQIYGLEDFRPNSTVLSESINLTALRDSTTTEFPIDLIVTTYQPLLIPIPTTNPKFNTENIDNNVNDEKSEKFSPNIYAETIFLPVAPKNYHPDLTHESLVRSNKFNLLDFTGYIHPPVLPDLSANSPDFPKAEKLVDSHLNIDPSDYKRRLKKSKKAGKSKKTYNNEEEDHSNYPKPFAVHDENYYPNNFYEYFKNDFYRNHRDRYDIDPRHYQNPQQQTNAQYYHPGGGTCPGGGHQNLVQQPPPLYYNYALQPIKFEDHPKSHEDLEEEEEEDDEEEEEEGDDEEEEEHQHADKKDEKKPVDKTVEKTVEKTNEKQKKAEADEEQNDYQDYNDEEEVEGDETDEEKKQNLKFRDTDEEERFHLDQEKIRDDREKFRGDGEKIKSKDSNEEEEESEEDYDEKSKESEEGKEKTKEEPKTKSSKAVKKGDDVNDEEEEEEEDKGNESPEYEDEEVSAEKAEQTKPVKEEEVEEPTTTNLPPTHQRVATFKIAPRPPLYPVTTTYYPPITTTDATYATESPSEDFTTVAGFRRRMNIVQQKLKRLNLLPHSTTPLYDISTLIPTSETTPYRPRRPNQRYTQLTTQQPFIINTNDDGSDEANPKAQYENIAEDAQEGKSEHQTYTVAPRRIRLSSNQNRNNNDGLNEQYGITTVPSIQPVNAPLYSQNLYFAPREQIVYNPNQYQYNQAKLVYNHPTQIQRPQVFPLTPETPNRNPNAIHHPTQARLIQPRIQNENIVTQPASYQTYTLYKHKRDIAADSTTNSPDVDDIEYRIVNKNSSSTNESDVAASDHFPVNISSGGRRTVEQDELKLNEAKGTIATTTTTTAVPDVKKTDNGAETEPAKDEKSEEPSPQNKGRKVLDQAKYFQDFFAAQLRPDLLEFGHLCEDPNDWEERFERKDMKDERHQGKVRWGDKKGGYGEHYWDLNHHKPKIEVDVSSNVNSDKNSNSDKNINININKKSSKIQTAADDHESDDQDGVEQEEEYEDGA